MFKNKAVALLVVTIGAFSLAPTALAQLSDAAISAVDLAREYRIVPNITYLRADNWDAKLDVYLPRDVSEPNLTLIYIHGGGWVRGSKEASALTFLPFLEMGWSVVNVEYRLGPVSLAPAAVEDCLCALRWVIRNAEEYQFDVDRLVTSGHSAGGHLALTTGMLPASAGLDRQCPGMEELKVAAIINWFGITDVPDLLEGSNVKSYAVEWMGSMPNRKEIGERVSPLNYARGGLPPILTIHGDADPIVPYSHAVRLHEELEKAGVSNELLTIPGGEHGGFSRDRYLDALSTIQDFLNRHGLMKPVSDSSEPRR